MQRDYSRLKVLGCGLGFLGLMYVFPTSSLSIKTVEKTGEILECSYEGMCQVLIDGVVYSIQGNKGAMGDDVLVTLKENLPVSFSPMPTPAVYHAATNRCLDPNTLSHGRYKEMPCNGSEEAVILHGDRKLPGTR